MDWFERLTGFRETDYNETRANLKVEGRQLQSLVNGKSYGIGELELVSLQALRERVQSSNGLAGRLKASVVTGDVRQMHRLPENAGALFQVASQFNMLEMTGPGVTPENGVTIYQHDHTQGPACAIAAGAATIYRNYFAPVGGSHGQAADRQLDGLGDLGEALSEAVKQPVGSLWEMRNGYALCSSSGLDAISALLGRLQPGQVDALRGKLRIGIHTNVEVTDADGEQRSVVSQAFCSTSRGLQPCTGGALETIRVALEAAYEATMLAAALNKQRGASDVVLLTLLGGGAFGNADDWIHGAIRRALTKMSGFALNVRLVSYREPSLAVEQLMRDFG